MAKKNYTQLTNAQFSQQVLGIMNKSEARQRAAETRFIKAERSAKIREEYAQVATLRGLQAGQSREEAMKASSRETKGLVQAQRTKNQVWEAKASEEAKRRLAMEAEAKRKEEAEAKRKEEEMRRREEKNKRTEFFSEKERIREVQRKEVEGVYAPNTLFMRAFGKK